MKKGLLFLTILTMAVAGFSVASHAREGRQVTGLGTGTISDPNAPAPDDKTSTWSGSYVWYGKYDVDKNNTAEPVKYRMLDKKTDRFGGNTLFLDCDSILDKKAFSGSTHVWKDSDLHSFLNGQFLYDFTQVETTAMAESTVGSHELVTGTDPGCVSESVKNKYNNYVALDHDKVFVLDAEDVSNTKYGYMVQNDECKVREKKKGDYYLWWLRSNDISNSIGYVEGTPGGIPEPGALGYSHPPAGTYVEGVSPAFNVNLNSVIYTTLESGTAGEPGAEYKLTLSDNDLHIALTQGKSIKRNGEEITVPYTITGDNKDNVTQVSVLLTESKYTTGEAKTEGFQLIKLSGDIPASGTGTGTFTLPNEYKNKKCGKDYYAYILAEDVNGEHETDYASAPVSITIPSYIEITEQPKDLTLTYGYKSGNILSVKAVGSGKDTLSYQWYSSLFENESYSLIQGATESTYTIPDGIGAGSVEYYYCEIMDSNVQPAKVSSTSKVEVVKADYTGESTQDYYLSGKPLKAVTDDTCDLSDLPKGFSYTEDVNISGGDGFITKCQVDAANKQLIFSAAEQAEPKTAEIKIRVNGGKNYNDYYHTVYIKSRKDAGVKISGGDRSVTYGADSFKLDVSISDMGAPGTTDFVVEDPKIAEVDQGTVNIKAAGTTRITAKYETFSTYGEDTITLEVKKADLRITKYPEGKTGLVYDGSVHELISPGKTEDGEFKYAVTTDEREPFSYTEDIPEGEEAGTYYVWYKVFTDDNHKDFEAKCITVKIAEKDDPNNNDPNNNDPHNDNPNNDDPNNNDPDNNDPDNDNPNNDDPEKDEQPKTVTGLATGAISDPDHPEEGNDGWSGNYVYYGNYDVDNDGTAEPVKYRVLDKNTDRFGGNTIFLDCDSILYTSRFNEEGEHRWQDSIIRSGLNGDKLFEKDGCFEAPEKKAVHKSTVASHDLVEGTGEGQVSAWTKNDFKEYIALDNDRIFILDAEDVSNIKYGYSTTNEGCNDRKKAGDSGYWWLRSLFINDYYDSAGYVAQDSYNGGLGHDVGLTDIGVSPAFNVDRDSIIFTSRVSETPDEYKLTLSDNELKIAVTGGSLVTRNGNTVTVPYTITGSDSANAGRVSVLILDSPYSPGETRTEGFSYLELSIDSFSASDTGTFTLPDPYAGKKIGEDYYVYILAEDVNEGKETDYASAPEAITWESKSSADPDDPASDLDNPASDPDDPASDPKNPVSGNTVRVPVASEGGALVSFASPEDNFAAIVPGGSSDGTGGNIKNQELDFSNVISSGVDPSALKMTAIPGSKFKTKAKVKDKGSVKTTGGVKAKFNKKDSTVTITCKSSGTATFMMDDGNTYTVSFTVEKPKAVKEAKTMAAGSAPAVKTLTDLFGTHIKSGKLEIVKQKLSQAAVSDNSLIINPAEKDSIKLRYQYLNKKYKMNIKIK